jgi:hypothetical protein
VLALAEAEGVVPVELMTLGSRMFEDGFAYNMMQIDRRCTRGLGDIIKERLRDIDRDLVKIRVLGELYEASSARGVVVYALPTQFPIAAQPRRIMFERLGEPFAVRCRLWLTR